MSSRKRREAQRKKVAAIVTRAANEIVKVERALGKNNRSRHRDTCNPTSLRSKGRKTTKITKRSQGTKKVPTTKVRSRRRQRNYTTCRKGKVSSRERRRTKGRQTEIRKTKKITRKKNIDKGAFIGFINSTRSTPKVAPPNYKNTAPGCGFIDDDEEGENKTCRACNEEFITYSGKNICPDCRDKPVFNNTPPTITPVIPVVTAPEIMKNTPCAHKIKPHRIPTRKTKHFSKPLGPVLRRRERGDDSTINAVEKIAQNSNGQLKYIRYPPRNAPEKVIKPIQYQSTSTLQQSGAVISTARPEKVILKTVVPIPNQTSTCIAPNPIARAIPHPVQTNPLAQKYQHVQIAPSSQKLQHTTRHPVITTTTVAPSAQKLQHTTRPPVITTTTVAPSKPSVTEDGGQNKVCVKCTCDFVTYSGKDLCPDCRDGNSSSASSDDDDDDEGENKVCLQCKCDFTTYSGKSMCPDCR